MITSVKMRQSLSYETICPSAREIGRKEERERGERREREEEERERGVVGEERRGEERRGEEGEDCASHVTSRRVRVKY